MKKIPAVVVILVAALILAPAAYVLITFPPIMRGMAAKTMCSCVFVSGRSPESVRKKELQVFPGMSDIALDVDWEDSSVTTRMLWAESKAIYRKGLGCTLLAEADEAMVRKQQWFVSNAPLPDQDTIPWPSGNLHAVTQSGEINRRALSHAVDAAFEEIVRDEPINTHAVVVVHEDKIIAERYAEGFGPHSIFTGWSMTKSITNALIGILVAEGKLGLNDPAPFPEWQKDDRRYITLNHLLQASSGLSWSESYFRPDADFHRMFIHSDDKAGYAASRNLSHAPGSHFQYSSGTTNILSKIIRHTLGDEQYHRFPREQLFSRIGMHSALIEPDASGTFVASSYGHATARDWARLGLLYLHDGVWNGVRILPEGWVQYSTTPAPAAPKKEYGAQLWLNAGEKDAPGHGKFPGLPAEAIVFSGFEDNFVVILPSRELVVVRLGVTHNDHFSLAALVMGVVAALPGKETIALRE